MKDNYINCLDGAQTAELEKLGVDLKKVANFKNYSGVKSIIFSDDLYNMLPEIVNVDGDDCIVQMSSATLEDEKTYIVSCNRVSDGWVCKTFVGHNFSTALFECVKYFINELQIDPKYYYDK